MKRRRFLAIAAAALVAPSARASTWRGVALGADVSITLRGPERLTKPALTKIRATLQQMELLFSLHNPASVLARLNQAGQLGNTPAEFADLVALCSRLHTATNGCFDPTVQPLWQALARGEEASAARELVGWDRVSTDGQSITLAPGQQLTFNGIAQGFATDRVAELLRAAGFSQTLVNIGEFRALGGPWRLGIADPDHGLVSIASLEDRAIATSSPAALAIGPETHILHPRRPDKPRWSTVSVEAEQAAIADGLSTAFCHMTTKDIRAALDRTSGSPVARLVTEDGRVQTLS